MKKQRKIRRKEIREEWDFIITKLEDLCMKRTQTCQYPFKQFYSSEARILSIYSRDSPDGIVLLNGITDPLLNSPIWTSFEFSLNS
jgi:hypothetical protein